MNKPALAFAFLLAAGPACPASGAGRGLGRGRIRKRHRALRGRGLQECAESVRAGSPRRARQRRLPCLAGPGLRPPRGTNSGPEDTFFLRLGAQGPPRLFPARRRARRRKRQRPGVAVPLLPRGSPIVGGSVPQALAVARRIEAVDRAAGARARAAYHEAKKDFSAAEAALEKARALQPDDSGHLLGHASFLVRRGRFAEADELFDEALRRDPDNPAVWLSRAKASIAAKRESKYDEGARAAAALPGGASGRAGRRALTRMCVSC